MNAREFLGDELVNNLQNAGYTDESIVDFAKKNYFKAMRDERERLSARGLDGASVQAVMRGEISEEAATKKAAAAKTLQEAADKVGGSETLARYGEGFADGGYNAMNVYNKGLKYIGDSWQAYDGDNLITRGLKSAGKAVSDYAGEKLNLIKLRNEREKGKLDKAYHDVYGADKWNVAGALGEFVGEAALDPITYLTGGSFTVGKGAWAAARRALFNAAMGAGAGTLHAIGTDDEVNLGRDAALGAVLGAGGSLLLDGLMRGAGASLEKINAIRASRGDKPIPNLNAETLEQGAEVVGEEIRKSDRLSKEQWKTVWKEFNEDAPTSSIYTDAEEWQAKKNMLSLSEHIKAFRNDPKPYEEYVKSLDKSAKLFNEKARKGVIQFNELNKIAKELKAQNPNADDDLIRQTQNASVEPTREDTYITLALNDGERVEPRLSGFRVIANLEASIKAAKHFDERAMNPEKLSAQAVEARLKEAGFGDKARAALMEAYVKRDINIAKEWARSRFNEKAEFEATNAFARKAKERVELTKGYDKSGKGFVTKDGGDPYQYEEHVFEVEQWINDISDILTPAWKANLTSLAKKHPEMFKSPADVFRVIKEVKQNPNRFFANNNPENALIGKDLESGKFGEIAVRKEDGQIVHTTKNDPKRAEKLAKRNENLIGENQLTEVSDRARRLPRHSDTSPTMPTDETGSIANEGIIPNLNEKVNRDLTSLTDQRKALLGDYGEAMLKGDKAKSDALEKQIDDLDAQIDNIKKESNASHDEHGANGASNNGRDRAGGEDANSRGNESPRSGAEYQNQSASSMGDGRTPSGSIQGGGQAAIPSREAGRVSEELSSMERPKSAPSDSPSLRGDSADKVVSNEANPNPKPNEPQGSELTDERIGAAIERTQGETGEELRALNNKYDVAGFLRDRWGITARETRSSRNLVSPREIRSVNKGEGWEREVTPAVYEPNHKADFATTQGDINKILRGKADAETLAKLKADLEGSEYLGYEYRRPSEAEMKAAGMVKDKDGEWVYPFSHPNIGGGLAGGTMNGVYEDENGDIHFDPARFFVGAVVGAAATKGLTTLARKRATVAMKQKREKIRPILRALIGKKSTNADGRTATFTKDSLEKMLSGKAIGKSLDNGFSVEEHFKAAENVLEIFKKAKFVESQIPKNESPDIIAFHKYLGDFNDNDVKITIKELKKHGNRFYSVEVLEVSPKTNQTSNPKFDGFGESRINHTGEELLSKNASSPINPSNDNSIKLSIKSQDFNSNLNAKIQKELGEEAGAELRAYDEKVSENVARINKELERENIAFAREFMKARSGLDEKTMKAIDALEPEQRAKAINKANANALKKQGRALENKARELRAAGKTEQADIAEALAAQAKKEWQYRASGADLC